MPEETDCDECGGTGEYWSGDFTATCKPCGGSGTVMEDPPDDFDEPDELDDDPHGEWIDYAVPS